jgi:hypothetical protein
MRALDKISSELQQYVPRLNTHAHYAMLLKRGKVIATGQNRVSSRSSSSGSNTHTMHAECSVIKSLGNLSLLRGCTLIVYRINRDSELRNSKPCHDCFKLLQKCISKWGLNKVLYT